MSDDDDIQLSDATDDTQPGLRAWFVRNQDAIIGIAACALLLLLLVAIAFRRGYL